MGNEGRKELHKKIITNFLVYLLGIILVIFVVPKLLGFFMPMIVAWVIATIANPMVGFLEKKIKIMRKHGSAVVIIAVLVLVGALLYLAVYATFMEVLSLIKELPEAYEQLIINLQHALTVLHERFSFIPNDLQSIIGKQDGKLNSLVLSSLDSLKSNAISSVGGFASSVINMVVLAILTLMLSYFFVAERERVKQLFMKCIPLGVKNFWNMAVDTCFRAIAGYLKACFKIMIIMFFILLLIFTVFMRNEYAWLLALITAFLDFLPFLGTGIIITPWAIYCLITGEYISVVILVITYVICLLVHRLLEPKLVGDSVGMSPFATLVSMVIGYRLIGMLGLILGIPVGMILIAFKEQGVFDPLIRGIKILARDINEYRKY